MHEVQLLTKLSTLQSRFVHSKELKVSRDDEVVSVRLSFRGGWWLNKTLPLARRDPAPLRSRKWRSFLSGQKERKLTVLASVGHLAKITRCTKCKWILSSDNQAPSLVSPHRSSCSRPCVSGDVALMPVLSIIDIALISNGVLTRRHFVSWW